MITKDFDKWNDLKKYLETTARNSLFYEEGDIWWCSLGLNLGSEQDGKNQLYERPAVILKKFNDHMALIIPLTSVEKNTSYHIHLDVGFAISSQARLISVKRFQRFVKNIGDWEIARLKEQFATMIKQV